MQGGILLTILIKAAIILLISAIAVIDYKKRIIQNLMVLILIALGLILKGFSHETVKALLLLLPLFWFWHRGKIGAGDVKLFIALAVIIANPLLLYISMLITLICGVLLNIAYRIMKKNITAKIAFAPLIAIGAITAIIFI